MTGKHPSAERLEALPLPAFLRAVGKREIRPGGSHGWKTASDFLGAKPGERVLLVSTHWKRGKLPVGLAGTGVVVTSIEALPIDYDGPCEYDAIVLEDELSYLSDGDATAVLNKSRALLRRGGRLILHELLWRQTPGPELLDDLPGVWGRAPKPRLMRGWWDLLCAAGFDAPTQEQGGASAIGALPWFRPRQLEADEGTKGGLDFVFEALTGGGRTRYLRALDHFTAHDRAYGWVVLACSASEA